LILFKVKKKSLLICWLFCSLFIFYIIFMYEKCTIALLLLIDLLPRVELRIKEIGGFFFFSIPLVFNCNFKQKAGQRIFFNLIKIKLLDSTQHMSVTDLLIVFLSFGISLVYIWCRTFSMIFLIGMWSSWHLLCTVYYLFELKSQLFSNPLFRLHPKSIYTVFILRIFKHFSNVTVSWWLFIISRFK
jgi:hypothetical protein